MLFQRIPRTPTHRQSDIARLHSLVRILGAKLPQTEVWSFWQHVHQRFAGTRTDGTLPGTDSWNNCGQERVGKHIHVSSKSLVIYVLCEVSIELSIPTIPILGALTLILDRRQADRVSACFYLLQKNSGLESLHTLPQFPPLHTG